MSMAPAIALVSDASGVFLIAAFEVTYFTRKEFMPYHSVPVGARWLELDPRIRALLLWALYDAPVEGPLVTTAFAVGMTVVSRHSQARPPWSLVAVGGTLFLVGLAAAFLA